MKVIIAGSRSIEDIDYIEEAIVKSGFNITEVVSGTARGVDMLGEFWAENNDISIKKFPAKWNDINVSGAVIKRSNFGRYNVLAGYQRNEQMAEYADALIAVWDGKSKGTKHMIGHMKKINKSVFIHKV